jgi:hypothetical protein
MELVRGTTPGVEFHHQSSSASSAASHNNIRVGAKSKAINANTLTPIKVFPKINGRLWSNKVWILVRCDKTAYNVACSHLYDNISEGGDAGIAKLPVTVQHDYQKRAQSSKLSTTENALQGSAGDTHQQAPRPTKAEFKKKTKPRKTFSNLKTSNSSSPAGTGAPLPINPNLHEQIVTTLPHLTLDILDRRSTVPNPLTDILSSINSDDKAPLEMKEEESNCAIWLGLRSSMKGYRACFHYQSIC